MTVRQFVEKIITIGFYLFVFLLPWQTRWIWHQGMINGGAWEYGTRSIYGTDILLILLVVLAMAISRPQQPGIPQRFTVPLVGLLLVSFASIFWSLNKELSWFAAVKLAEGLLIVWLVLRLRFSWRTTGVCLVAAGFIQSVLAIAQFFSQSVFASKWLGMAAHRPDILGDSVVETTAGRFLRAYGSLPHPNMLAGFLVICLFITIGFLFSLSTERRANLLTKVAAVTSFVVTTYALVLTFSRSAWLALAAGFVLLAMINYWPGRQIRLKVLAQVALWIILLSVFSAFLLPELWLTRLGATGRLEVQSLAQRQSYYQQSTGVIEQHWYSGVGIGSYTQALIDTDGTKAGWDYQPVHNLYVLVAAELGIFGVAVFLLLIWEFVRTFLYRRAVEARERSWYAVYGTTFIAQLLLGLFDHYSWTFSFGIMLFWLVFAFWLKHDQSIALDEFA